MKLFIDDLRTIDMVYEDDDFVVVRTYDESIAFFETHGCPDFISFDHDLADFKDNVERTGFTITKWLVERDMDMKGTFIPDNFSYHVHSANHQGKLNIEGLLDHYLADRIGRIWN